jgi:hypothetical protein
MTIQSSNIIPTVDFKGFLDDSDKQAVADIIVSSFKDIGFVCLVNHGLPQGRIDQMFDWVRHLYSDDGDLLAHYVLLIVQAFLCPSDGGQAAGSASAIWDISSR